MLEEAVKANFAHDESCHIRLVGDGHSVLLRRISLVRPDHQRQVHWNKTLRRGFKGFPNVHQRPLPNGARKSAFTSHSALSNCQASKVVFDWWSKGLPSKVQIEDKYF